jgi:tetratricopeptide (TPR) repeat protein
LGIVADQYDWNHLEAGANFERALTLDPRLGAVRCQRALYLFLHHDFTGEQTRAELERAVHDDPLNGWVLAMSAHILGFMGLHVESLDQSQRAFALDRESFFAHWNVVRSHAWLGDYPRAIEMSPELLRVSGRHQWGLGMLAWSLGKAGLAERARAIHDELMARSRSEFVAPFWLAASAATCGLEEEATRQVERAAREHDPLLPWGPVAPTWDQVRVLPRFADIVAEVMW